MKLRNKDTGKVYDFECITLFNETDETGGGDAYDEYYGIDAINEIWEDYKPTEPLIKDEDKLDAVKSFFALLGITKEIYYQVINNCFYHTDDDGITYAIDFKDDSGFDNIHSCRAYTITELCGEEEE